MSAARPFRRRSLPLGGGSAKREGGDMSAARPFRRRSPTLGGRSADVRSCLRTSERLATQPRLQAPPRDALGVRGAR
jgi:hypothetical protein